MTRALDRRRFIGLAGLVAGAAALPSLVTAQGASSLQVVNTDRLNVRADAGLGFDVLEVLVFGDEVTADASQRKAVDGVNWIYVHVTASGTEGWVDSKELTEPGNEALAPDAGAATAETLDDGTFIAAATQTLYISVADANLRSGAGLSYDVITTLPIGQAVTVSGATEEADGYTWYPVMVSTIAGWVANIVVADAAPENPDYRQGAMVIIDTDVLNLRAEAGISAAVIATYTYETSARIVSAAPVTADAIAWHQVEMTDDGNVGWLAEEFLSPSGMGGDAFTITIVDGPLNLRTEPGTAGSVLAELPAGTTGQLWSTGPVEKDGFAWVEIVLNDQTGRKGWIASELVSFT